MDNVTLIGAMGLQFDKTENIIARFLLQFCSPAQLLFALQAISLW